MFRSSLTEHRCLNRCDSARGSPVGIAAAASFAAVLCFLGGYPERSRAISTARLCVLPHLHLRPIDVIVSDGPIWRSYLEGGFVLRCFQHLS